MSRLTRRPPVCRRLLAAAALLSLPAGLSAHRFWMLPSGTVFSGSGNWVTVDAAVSDDLFFEDHQPGRLENIKVWQPDGTPGKLQNGATGRYRSVFDVQLDQPGTWKIGFEQANVMGSFKVDGVERRVGGRGGPPPGGGQTGSGSERPGGERREGTRDGAMPGMGPNMGGQAAGGMRQPPVAVADIPANATDVKLTEISSRNEIYVTTDKPTRTVFTPTGHGLEIAPITHPDELVAGEIARFRFLVDGRPAAGMKVAVIPGGKRYRDAEQGVELTTGADGVVAVTWPAAGMYWLNATMTDNHPSTPRATERRLSYATTLEVLTP